MSNDEIKNVQPVLNKASVSGSPSLSEKRVIKFRGKDAYDGAWCKGFLFIDKNNKYWIITDKNTPSNLHLDEVIPESVGQAIGVNGYTGNYYGRHNNQVELFEGDIVEAWSEGSRATFVIKYRNEGNPCWLLYPNWQSKKHWSISASNIGTTNNCFYDDLKLLGNVYENPELLRTVQQ